MRRQYKDKEKRERSAVKWHALSFDAWKESYKVVVNLWLPVGGKLLCVLLKFCGLFIGIGHCVQGLAVFERGNSHEGLEHPLKIGQAFITQLMGNLRDAHVCLLQQAFGLADAVYVGVLSDCVSRNLLKGAADIIFTEIKVCGQLLQGYVLFAVFGEIVCDGVGCAVFGMV